MDYLQEAKDYLKHSAKPHGDDDLTSDATAAALIAIAERLDRLIGRSDELIERLDGVTDKNNGAIRTSTWNLPV